MGKKEGVDRGDLNIHTASSAVRALSLVSAQTKRELQIRIACLYDCLTGWLVIYNIIHPLSPPPLPPP